MLGVYPFGSPYYGQAPSNQTPEPPGTHDELFVECKNLTCVAPLDFQTYNLQDGSVRTMPDIELECRTLDCVGNDDLPIYSLQDAIFFNGTPLTFVVTCPPGFVCPDGFSHTVTYPPGTFVFPDPGPCNGFPIVLSLDGCQSTVSRTLPCDATPAEIQAAANQIILAVAQQQAICDTIDDGGPFPPVPEPGNLALSDLSDELACLGVAYSGQIVATSIYVPVTMIITGSLPTGIVAAQSVDSLTLLLSGTPTVPGDYPFSVTASAPVSSNVTTDYELVIFGIVNSSPLPAGTPAVPYSETLTTAGTVIGPITFAVTSGVLPDGLTLNATTGEISGTPTTSETQNFVVTATAAGSGIGCPKTFSLTIGAPCPFPSSFAWFDINGPTYVPTANFSTLTFASGSIQVAGFADPEVLPDPTPSGAYDTKMSFVYAGPGFDLHFRGTYNVVGNNNSGFFIQAWDGDVGTGNLINTIFIDPFTVATPYDEIITIPTPVNGYVTLWMVLNMVGCSSGGACSGVTTVINYNMTIGC